jgi:hypothetical protein
MGKASAPWRGGGVEQVLVLVYTFPFLHNAKLARKGFEVYVHLYGVITVVGNIIIA